METDFWHIVNGIYRAKLIFTECLLEIDNRVYFAVLRIWVEIGYEIDRVA